MAISLPSALEQGSDPGVIVEATYFVIRVLRNGLRGYEKAEVSPEGSDEAFRLATRALDEIGTMEGSDVSTLTEERLVEYIERLEQLSSQKFEASVGGYDAERATQLLDSLRERKPA
ncbi:MAG: hypothetical protein ABSB69_14185 [Solirubrobacteraceae bacterium]|jgi:hypothetical protein